MLKKLVFHEDGSLLVVLSCLPPNYMVKCSGLRTPNGHSFVSAFVENPENTTANGKTASDESLFEETQQMSIPFSFAKLSLVGEQSCKIEFRMLVVPHNESNLKKRYQLAFYSSFESIAKRFATQLC